MNSKKVHQENEEEQFKQALSVVRQGGVRKIRVDGNKGKAKHHQLSPFKIQKPELIPTYISDMESAGEVALESPGKSDYSEPENNLSFVESTARGALNLNKIRENFPRNSQNLGARYG